VALLRTASARAAWLRPLHLRVSAPAWAPDALIPVLSYREVTGFLGRVASQYVDYKPYDARRDLPNGVCNMNRPPLPPFTAETAAQKARTAEDAWNTREPARVALAYTTDSRWRNRAEFIQGRAEIEAFLTRKWNRELDYRLIKEVWAFRENRIAVRFAYEWHDDSGSWFRSYGNENWEFDEHGLMRLRIASINDLPIKESERKYHWPLGRRPDDHPSLSDLGL
jgi:uncharacterized protein